MENAGVGARASSADAAQGQRQYGHLQEPLESDFTNKPVQKLTLVGIPVTIAATFRAFFYFYIRTAD